MNESSLIEWAIKALEECQNNDINIVVSREIE